MSFLLSDWALSVIGNQPGLAMYSLLKNGSIVNENFNKSSFLKNDEHLDFQLYDQHLPYHAEKDEKTGKRNWMFWNPFSDSKETKEEVIRFANGTIDWGTPGNRPR